MQSGRRLTDLEPAGFARRASAFVIDALIVGVLLAVIAYVIDLVLGDGAGRGVERGGGASFLYALLAVWLPAWLYFAMEAGRGVTPGKRWLRIEVVSFAGSGLTHGQAALRNLVKLLPFIVAHAAIVIPANPFVDPRTGDVMLPALDALGPTVLGGLLVALLLFGVLLFTTMLHPDGRGAHDLLAGTFTVRAGPAELRAGAPVPGRPPESGTHA